MELDETPTLYKHGTTFVQYLVGLFLYYSRSLDVTILLAPKNTSLQQSKQKKLTKAKCQRLMDYLVIYSDAYI